MSQLVEVEILVLELLLVVSVVAIIVRRFRIPYTVALVLAGLILSLRSPLELEVTPELILSLFLPPLVFEAAFQLDLEKLRKNLSTILLLAIPGVVLTMLIVGGIISWGTSLSLSVALIFGALVAATDPVSVVAIFRKIGAPKRLEVLLEGESLFNDGTAIVLFNLALAAFLTGEFNLIDGLIDFARVAGGGVLIGLLLGWLVSRLIGRIDEYLVETTLTTVLAFGAYLLAEQIHVSGVLAVVLAGVVSGNLSSREMSPTTRIVVFNFWEYVAFLANSAVFLLIGLEIDIPALVNNWQPILWAIFAILVSRAVGIYGLSRFGREIPSRWRHVLFWGGLRGAIALALAISLPPAMGTERETVLVMSFGIVLFTLLGQGLSMDPLIKRLGLIERSEEQIEYERRHARALAARAGVEHLSRLHRDGLISSHTWEELNPILSERVQALTDAVQEVLQSDPELEREEFLTSRREMLRAQRSTLVGLRRTGVISDESYEDLVTEVDTALQSELVEWRPHSFEEPLPVDVCQLLMVVVQDRDLESVSNALSMRGIRNTRIRSTGGFLRQQNHLLMVGVSEGGLDAAIQTIQHSSRSRVEYLASTFESASFTLGQPVPIEVRGATVFVFNVERCEEI
jgi:CPA1 family monovalent cation:H+ antiporter